MALSLPGLGGGTGDLVRVAWSHRRHYHFVWLFLVLAAVLVERTGGVSWRTTWFSLSITRGWRLATVAFATWLLGVTWDSKVVARTALLVPLAGLFLAAAADSQPHRVGDSHEYVAMSRGLAALSGPARSIEAVTAGMESDWQESSAAFPLVVPSLRGRDGKYDFPHFWFYPALAAPLVRFTDAIGIHVRWAFFALNVALLLIAAAALASRVGRAGALVLAGPVLWWVDKPHTELFTWSLLVVAMCALRRAPWWSLVAVGAAAAQNPPFAIVLPLTIAWVVLVAHERRREVWIGAGVAAVLAAIPPAYYQWRLGIWSALAVGAIPHLPSPAELSAVVLDPNIGILANAPVFLALIVAAGVLAIRPFHWPRASSDAWYAGLVGLVFLCSFSQAANVNSGGTPNPSRYGLWLIPLLVPAVALVSRRAPVTLKILATFGLAWSLVLFHPHLGDHYLRPTGLASLLWEHWPNMDNPLPEVFSERVGGDEGVQSLPLATPGCTKALLAASADGVRWPASCGAREVPAWCREPGVLCYANRVGREWTFTRAPRQAGFRYQLR